MSDGTVLNTGANGDKIDTEDFGARGKVSRVKIVLGALDVDGGDVTASNPVPTDPIDRAGRLLGQTDVTDRLARVLGQMQERYLDMEALADQAGAGAVLTFTFANGAPDLIWVISNGTNLVSRAVIGSQTPSATLGVYCADGVPSPMTLSGQAVVKVFAPVGATVSMWGYRYA